MVPDKKYFIIIIGVLFMLSDIFSRNTVSSQNKIDKKFLTDFNETTALCKQMDLPIKKVNEYTFGGEIYLRKPTFWLSIFKISNQLIFINGYELDFKIIKNQIIITDIRLKDGSSLNDSNIINLFKSDKIRSLLQDIIKFLKKYEMWSIEISQIYNNNYYYSEIITLKSGRFLTLEVLVYFEKYFSELKPLYVKDYHVKNGVEIDDKFLHYFK